MLKVQEVSDDKRSADCCEQMALRCPLNQLALWPSSGWHNYSGRFARGIHVSVGRGYLGHSLQVSANANAKLVSAQVRVGANFRDLLVVR